LPFRFCCTPAEGDAAGWGDVEGAVVCANAAPPINAVPSRAVAIYFAIIGFSFSTNRLKLENPNRLLMFRELKLGSGLN
jgi:hypothetical protein